MRIIRKIINKDHYLAGYSVKEFPEFVILSKDTMKNSNVFIVLTFDPTETRLFLTTQHGTIKATVLYNFLQGIINGRSHHELIEWGYELEGDFLTVGEMDKLSVYSLLHDCGMTEEEMEEYIGPLESHKEDLNGVEIIFVDGEDKNERKAYLDTLKAVYEKLDTHHAAHLFSGKIVISSETNRGLGDVTIHPHSFRGSDYSEILSEFGKKFYHALRAEDQHDVRVFVSRIDRAKVGDEVTYHGDGPFFQSASPYTVISINEKNTVLRPVSGEVTHDGKTYRNVAIRTDMLLNGNWKANGTTILPSDIEPVDGWADIFTRYILDDLDEDMAERVRDIVEKKHVNNP